jgi:hypothetical protein
VDAQLRRQLGARGRRDLADFPGQRAAVGVAQYHHVRPGAFGGLPGGQRIVGVVLVTIERVLGVVDDEAAAVLEKRNRVRDHREVFVRGGLEDLLDV